MAILECELYESTVLELSDFWIEVPTERARRQGRAVLRLLSLRFCGESADNPRNYDFAKYQRVRPDAFLPGRLLFALLLRLEEQFQAQLN